MKRPKSILAVLNRHERQQDKPLPTPEGLRCLTCPHNGIMCNRVCREEKPAIRKRRSSAEL